MRLLLLNHNYRFGGTYYRAMPMAEQLARRGHEVTLLTVSRQNRYKTTWSDVNGVNLGEMPNLAQNNSGEGYGPLDNLCRLIHAFSHPYDIIHMFDHKPNASLGGFAGKLRGARLVADWADWWGGAGGINDVPRRRVPAIGQFEEWWEMKSKLWADGVVAISRILAQRAMEAGCPPDRVIHIPTGAAVDRIRPVPVKLARSQLGIPQNRRIVGFIGMGQGDLDIVMNALRRLPDVWLMVIGGKNPRVIEQARSFGVDGRLWQTGFARDEEVELYLGCANIMCLPMKENAANRGRLPNKILDYMCAGRPTVASSIGDIRMIVDELEVGVLSSDDCFAEAIDNLFADAHLREFLGDNARRAAETVFNWSNLMDRLEDFYFRIVMR